MSTKQMLDRYLQTRPLVVMTRMILNEVITDELDGIFHQHRQQGDHRELLYSQLAALRVTAARSYEFTVATYNFISWYCAPQNNVVFVISQRKTTLLSLSQAGGEAIGLISQSVAEITVQSVGRCSRIGSSLSLIVKTNVSFRDVGLRRRSKKGQNPRGRLVTKASFDTFLP